MKNHLRLFRNTKNKFIMHFDAFLTLIFLLEKWAFLGFFAFFGPKSPKIGKTQFSSAWKRCNFHFLRLKFFFKKFRHFRTVLHIFWFSNSKNSKIQRVQGGRSKFSFLHVLLLQIVSVVERFKGHFWELRQNWVSLLKKVLYRLN